MKKISVILAIITIMIMGSCFASSISFKDLDTSHWAYSTIIDMAENGLIKGYDDSTFKPEKEVTREEFAQMVYNAVKKEATTEQLQNYYDVSSSRWSYKAVQLVGNSLKDTSDGYVYFHPTKPIERQEVAKIITDIFELSVEEGKIKFLNDGPSSDYDVMRSFLKDGYRLADVDVINNDYLWEVCCVLETGFMKGISDTEFAPAKSLTRAQAATMVSRMVGNKEEKPVEPIQNDIDLNLEFLKLENEKSNLIYSPLSIKYALKMLSCGANGKTKSEIDSLVGGVTLTKYKNMDKVLSLANSIFIRDTYKEYVKNEFIKQVNDGFDAEIKIDAFANASNVNNWISEKTFGIIKNMIKDDLVRDPDLAMLLINALAIDMEWDNGFGFDKTTGRDFTLEDGSKVKATTMHKETKSDSASYYIDDKVTVLSMDLKEYDGVQLEFDAIMPNEKLSDFTNNTSSEEINELLGKTKSASSVPAGLNIFIPKFKFEYDLNLQKDLQTLGMNEAFSKIDADFSNMTNNPKGLYVGKALHKANIEFTEKGVKAAAVTVFAMFEKSSISIDPNIPIDVRIDKPFMFLIRDKETGEVWFVGTVYSPNLWENDQSEYSTKF